LSLRSWNDVSRAPPLEYDDVDCVIRAKNEETEWLRHELVGVDLSDERLDRRLLKTADYLAKSPTSPINEACGNWADTQGAYRLFDNVKASPRAILKPHTRATAQRMSMQTGPVLVMQDTVFFSYGKHPKTRGLGPIGKSNQPGERGLVMHNALAFTTSGVPLGVLSQCIWARAEVPEETRIEKILRLQCTAIEEKESSKWLIALRETVARTPAGIKTVTVADRESDFFEFLTQAEELRAHFLIRARIDRVLVPEESEGYERILEALLSAPVLGELTVAIPGNRERKARTATVQVRVARVTIKAPQRRGHAKASGSTESITVNVVGATEASPPAGIEAISWVLLTDLPVQSFTAAKEKVEWYGKRWGIETWHKVLKSGCEVEECMLEEASRLARYLTLFSIIGVRLMCVAYLARVQPDAPATEVFSQEEVEVAHLRALQTPHVPEKPSTLKEVVRMIGSIGGFLGRKGDGEPGVTVMWRGWMRLYESITMMRIIQKNPRVVGSH
jgi:hypothetical protein